MERVSGFSTKAQFDNFLQRLVHHAFVTEASLEKRSQLSLLIDELNKTARIIDPQATFAAFVAGSVGAGMALPNSDIDAQIFFSGEESALGSVRNEQDQFQFPPEVYLEDVERFSFLEEDNFRECIDRALGDKDNGESPFIWLSALAVVFYPSLNEFTDPREKTLVDSWRKRIVTFLVAEYPERAEEIWSDIKAYAETGIIRYEDKEDLSNPTRRKDRVRRIVEERIQQRFPHDEIKQQRARRITQSRQKTIRYPELKEMLEIFGIENS